MSPVCPAEARLDRQSGRRPSYFGNRLRLSQAARLGWSINSSLSNLQMGWDVLKNLTPHPSHSALQLSTAIIAAAFVAEYMVRMGVGIVATTEER